MGEHINSNVFDKKFFRQFKHFPHIFEEREKKKQVEFFNDAQIESKLKVEHFRSNLNQFISF